LPDQRRRVACFIDGFNLYHAIDNLGRPHLKWLDLRQLMSVFTDPARHEVTAVFYFSAFATWRPAPYERHRAYVAALRATGVTPVMGHFKIKDRKCPDCGHEWEGHEEKETDVNAALWLLDEAYRDNYDDAFIVSRDSDLAPAVRMVRARFPAKRLKVIATPRLRHSKELAQAVGNPNHLAAIKEIHLERSLLPERIVGTAGQVLAVRPPEYAPPYD
jgi:uncharacterized LabA/DUF88 family protein